MAKQYNNYNGRGNNYQNGNNKPQSTLDRNFRNPYSFVPVNNEVYLLNENETNILENAYDVPFEDGLSGKIKIDFETMTPICVKGTDGENANINGEYFIPGTSIKGMVRSVFEIIAKSNLRNGIANSRYSMRDLRSNDYELKSTNKPQKSGLLMQLNGRFYVMECFSEPWKYAEIEKEEGISNLKSCRSVSEKYRKLKSHIVEYSDGTFSMWFFSGFMNNKEHEFWFEIPDFFDEQELFPLEDDEYQDFRFIHEIENDNTSWKFWKKRLKNYSSREAIIKDKYTGIVPCFFRTFEKRGHICVKDLGFSFLYRQPYPKKTHDFLPESHTSESIDLAQSVFGYVKRENALKGRVEFGNAFIKNPHFESEQTFILGSPKPSFYPFYIEQQKGEKLKTYFSSGARLSGYKRFLVHQKSEVGNVPKSKVTTSFRPLSAGTKFSTVVYFHNLRDYELGALLAAITFCMKQNKCFHSLGYAKPYGYGKLKVTNIEFVECENMNMELLYNTFVNKICEKCNYKDENTYLNTIKDLFVIASEHNDNKQIRYPNMQKKEFNQIKNLKLSMKDF